MNEMYPPDGFNQPSEWELYEAVQAEAAYRRLQVRMGDIFAELAWLWIHKTGTGGKPNLRNADKACSCLLKACAQYELAGLTRRARSAWRYARVIHRAKGRAAV